uniref:Zinc finger BED domain-containing protein DAYSLEEPER-like n=1 Tax=Ananas comosus var. bracteatus TaxID=296719 RepID=A0A6V7PGM2_ANACO|nr:unnamed protein product [Ananas comosus var. bracteatus]
MQTKMVEKFEQYWKDYSLLLSIAAVLDPRHKMRLVEFCYKKLYGSYFNAYYPHVQRIQDATQRLFDWYKEKLGSDLINQAYSTPCELGGGYGASSSKVFREEDSTDDLLEEYYNDEKLLATTEVQSSKTELERYLEEPTYPREDVFEILEYWKNKQKKYPVISSMARYLLAVPITTVASESAFSAGGRVIDERRASLDPSTVEALMCAGDWIKQVFFAPEEASDNKDINEESVDSFG